MKVRSCTVVSLARENILQCSLFINLYLKLGLINSFHRNCSDEVFSCPFATINSGKQMSRAASSFKVIIYLT